MNIDFIRVRNSLYGYPVLMAAPFDAQAISVDSVNMFFENIRQPYFVAAC
jgi:hypothetical protein